MKEDRLRWEEERKIAMVEKLSKMKEDKEKKNQEDHMKLVEYKEQVRRLKA